VVGVSLPPGWRLELLGDLGQLLSGGTPTTSNEAYWNGDIPWVSAKDMKRARLSDAIDHVSDRALGRGTRLAPKHALLLVVRGMSLARSFPVARAEVELAFNQDLKALVPRADVDSDFLLWWLTAHESLFMGITTESTHGTKRLPTGAIRAVEVALPHETEQRAIATALSDVDSLLGALDRLIAKKRDLKQAAMQQLLTGQTRLPGFKGEWTVRRLGDLGDFLKGRGVRKGEANSGTLPCVRYGELYTHHRDVVRAFNSWISPEVALTATPLEPGDLLFAGSGETREDIGTCVAFVHQCEAYAGGDIVILRLREGHPLFWGYYCNVPAVASQKASKGQGDAVVHISARALAGIQVMWPDEDEQTAIASVLSDMDAEIEALESRRAKTRDIKQAMMQELLTGRTRLV
jgi:type I restriction enzyme S subunit